MGMAPGAGDDAIVGGEEGGKGDAAAMGLVSKMEEGAGREAVSLFRLEAVVLVLVAVLRD